MLLSLDASLETQSVTIAYGGSFLCSKEQKALSLDFLPMIMSLFEEKGLKPRELQSLAVITGPGSFTGIRSALIIAKTLASQLGLGVYAVNNFEILRYLRPELKSFAISLGEHNYYVSQDDDYDNPETNFFTNSLEVNSPPLVKFPSTNLSALLLDFLKANPREALSAENLGPYYLRLPHIGVAGETIISTAKGLHIEVNQNNLETLFTEALQAMSRSDFADAAQLLKRYISRRSSSPNLAAHELLAEAQLELGELSSAKREFLKSNNLSQAAFVAFLAGKAEEARHLYFKATESIAKRWGLFLCDYLYPQTHSSIESPGFMAFRLFCESTITYLLKNKKTQLVATLYLNAESLETIYPEFRKSMGSAYLGLRDYKKAIELFNSAKLVLVDDAELFYKLAEAQIAIGERDAAIESLRKVLSLLPGHIGSQRLLLELNPDK